VKVLWVSCVIEICLVAFGALLMLGSIAAFLLYVPYLPIVVAAVLLPLGLTFLLGVWAGGTRHRISGVL
jgi:hypothetical protein